jgi:hypothetical protein
MPCGWRWLSKSFLPCHLQNFGLARPPLEYRWLDALCCSSEAGLQTHQKVFCCIQAVPAPINVSAVVHTAGETNLEDFHVRLEGGACLYTPADGDAQAAYKFDAVLYSKLYREQKESVTTLHTSKLFFVPTQPCCSPWQQHTA